MSQFDRLSPDFAESMREFADKLAEERRKAAPQKPAAEEFEIVEEPRENKGPTSAPRV